MRSYLFVSVAFLTLGILYVALGIIGSVLMKRPMSALVISGILTSIHGVLLILNNDWVRSITKVACTVRLAVFAFMVMILAPYMFHMGSVGFGLFMVFVFDVTCLILMIRGIDDVYFA